MKKITFTKRFYDLDKVFVCHGTYYDHLMIGYASLSDAQKNPPFFGCVKEYTKSDIELAVELGDAWPFTLGFVEGERDVQQQIIADMPLIICYEQLKKRWGEDTLKNFLDREIIGAYLWTHEDQVQTLKMNYLNKIFRVSELHLKPLGYTQRYKSLEKVLPDHFYGLDVKKLLLDKSFELAPQNHNQIAHNRVQSTDLEIKHGYNRYLIYFKSTNTVYLNDLHFVILEILYLEHKMFGDSAKCVLDRGREFWLGEWEMQKLSDLIDNSLQK